MSSAQCVHQTWPRPGPPIFRRLFGSIPMTMRTVSSDGKGPPPSAKAARLRAMRLEQYAKRLEALKSGWNDPVKIDPPTRPAFQLDVPLVKERTLPPGRQIDRGHAPDRVEKRLDFTRTSFRPYNPADRIGIRNTESQWQKSFQTADPPQPLSRPVETSNAQDKTVFYRAVTITRLDDTSTLTDLTQAIAATGPFGMVTAASLDVATAGRRRATVVFNAEAAAQRLVAHAEMRGFRVGGTAPVVRLNTDKGFPDEARHPSFSRVLRIAGRPDVEGFDEASLRRILADIFKRPPEDGRWLDSEPPRTRWFADGNKAIDWAFFSNKFQTRPFQAALWQHFRPKLFVGYGLDPCGDFRDLGDEKREARIHFYPGGLVRRRAC